MIVNIIKIYAIIFLFLLATTFIGCGGSEDDVDNISYITDPHFNFHQDVNKLFVSAKVLPQANGKLLDNVKIEWKGTKETNESPDTLTLMDNGMSGDIIADDDIYTLKFKNDSSLIINTLGDDSGSVFIKIIATYIGQTEEKSISFKIGNIIPRVISIAAPDTIIRSSGANATLHLVSATVFDADGLDNIKWVGFTSFHIDGDSMMYKGNYIYLYDDGSEDIIYSPDITSGDGIRGDGIYSFKVPAYGSGNTDPNYQTKTGSFRWEFITQDKEDEYSLPAIHEIVIE